MRIKVVQKREKGTIGPPSPQPLEESVVDLSYTAGLEVDPLLVVEVVPTDEIAEAQDILEDPLPCHRPSEDRPRRQRIIRVVGEAPRKSGLVSAAVRVRDETRGLVALLARNPARVGTGASRVNVH